MTVMPRIARASMILGAIVGALYAFYAGGSRVAEVSESLGYITTTVDSSGSVGQYTSIAIGADGLPIVSYRDQTNNDLKVAHCGNAACSVDTALSTVDGAGGQYTSITIGADGLPVISYLDLNGVMKVAHCGNFACSAGNTVSVVDSSPVSGLYTSIAIGTDGFPVISYRSRVDDGLRVAHCGAVDCSAANTITTVDSGDVGRNTSITIGADGLPIISYLDHGNSDLKVAHCGSTACSAGNSINTVASDGDVGAMTSIAIGVDGLPVISYFDGTNADLKVAYCGNASCSAVTSLVTVDSAGSVGQYTSIAIGTDGLPIISYYALTNADLKVVHCGNVSCDTAGSGAINAVTTLDDTGSVGEYTSIAVGADGLPIISYWDIANVGNDDLKVVHCGGPSCDPNDSDGDGFPDITDDCPLTATPWVVPPGDGDCDFWTDADESTIGTDPSVACDDGLGLPDWPPDFNDDKTVNILDVLQFKPVFGAPSARHDLDASGGNVNILDVLQLKPVFNQSCT